MPVLPDWVNFQFTPKIHIEIDCGYKIGAFVKNIGSRVLLLSTQKEMQNTDELSIIKTSIEKHTDGVILYDDIEDKPTFKDLDTASHFTRHSQANCIVAYGSFDSINAAKAISLLASNDYFASELIIDKKSVRKKPIPLIVIPTMPVMGTECSPFFTVISDQDQYRKYFSHYYVFPELIIADPKISLHLTSTDIARTATAILSAAVDTLLSKFANEITSSSTLRAMELVAKNIIPSIRDPKNLTAKNALYSASLLTGISQSSSSLGLCFALSLATSNLTKMDIFQAMSILLPHIMEYNLTTSAGKYVMIAKALDEDISDISIIEAAIKAVEGVRKIYIELKIPQRLSEYEVKKIDLPGIASLAASFPFLDCLPRELPRNEIETILVAAF